ncbi:Gar1/Naf1 RNA binding region family protein [Babesia bovis T2Bo]|uniref:Gar1/Naf1 RNA binding region family protein n=1 Tax=Babesia bovis T2Bo TaxID=484906 RepID=UPI001D591AF5|nr:Gar1/Naf1 RNA binding region family protein [Babesia bovis T2Bo]EDO07269.2 Gar1/Naf1 RNA binding region family protein [Babesia bovis T2Bo]
MESVNGIVIDGKNEIDDLALVMHIANKENERLSALEALNRDKPRVFYRDLGEASSSSDSDESVVDLSDNRNYYNIGNSYRDAGDDKEYNPVVDPDFPVDNIRLVDTVDLPKRVEDHFPIALVGRCTSILGRIVVLRCTDPNRVLDLGSIVCLGDRRIIGTVSDTFGSTVEPFHMVICSDSSMLRPDDEIYYDVKHSTLVSDMHVVETASSVCSDGSSDDDCNPKEPDHNRKAVKLKQYYRDLEVE